MNETIILTSQLIGLGIGVLIFVIFLGVMFKLINNMIGDDTPKKLPENKDKTNEFALNPYLPRKYIFTNSEFACYKNMKIVADKYGLEIFCKVRFADLIDTRQGKDFNKWFNRVKSKHIDFVLLDEKTITPKLLIELDDSTHNREDRKKRDQFVDAVCAMCGLKIRHIKSYGAEYIENILLEENITNIPV